MYLALPDIDTRAASTGDGDFYLGLGQHALRTPGGRADLEVVEETILPALMTIVTRGAEVPLMRESLISVAKASRRTDSVGFWTTLRYLLEHNPTDEVKNAAALCFGVMQDDDWIDLLGEFARDSDSARRFSEVESIEPELRANAIYGLALAGGASIDRGQRALAVAELVAVVEDEDSPEDLRAAAVLAIGRIPLTPVEGCVACTCGRCEVGSPERSFEDQVSWVSNRFLDPRESNPVRAQAASALACLISNRPEAVSTDLEMQIIDLMIDALDRSAHQPDAVRHGAVLGLSMLGDADADHLDGWVRWALTRSTRTGDRLERRWALIGLGLVGSRPGEGDQPFAAADECREALVHHLSRARRSERPWAAMALGVMGHWLRVNGQQLDPDVDLALRAGVRNRRRADEAGAYALAVGLRRDAKALPALLEDFDSIRDPLARGHIALGIGLVGDRSANEQLHEVLVAKRSPDELRARVGLALGLLSDPNVVPVLLALLEQEDLDIATQLGTVRALGFLGDQRSAEAVGAVLTNALNPADLRQEAAIALGRMADDQALPWRGVLAVGTNYVSCPATLTNPAGTGALDLH